MCEEFFLGVGVGWGGGGLGGVAGGEIWPVVFSGAVWFS